MAADRAVNPPTESQDFSLGLGGPLFQLMRRARLNDDAQTRTRRRVYVFTAALWVPLGGLSATDRKFIGGGFGALASFWFLDRVARFSATGGRRRACRGPHASGVIDWSTQNV